jgi:hypothetical protein
MLVKKYSLKRILTLISLVLAKTLSFNFVILLRLLFAFGRNF